MKIVRRPCLLAIIALSLFLFAFENCTSQSGSAASATFPPAPIQGPNGDSYVYMNLQTLEDQTVFSRSSGAYPYIYAPDLLFFDGQYHLYGCAGVGGIGDYIIHAESDSPNGPFHSSTSSATNSFDISLQPTGSSADFDGTETCDPSVLEVGSTFYLYYGGLATPSNSTSWTKIGVATSGDGIHFSRANAGQAIVTPRLQQTDQNHNYGAGQPAVIYVSPYYYMSYTDTTAPGADPDDGSGQILIRSQDPLFASSIDELTQSGWVSRASTAATVGSFDYFPGGLSLDLAYDPMSNKVLAVEEDTDTTTSFVILDPANFTLLGSADLGGYWSDGAAIAKNADHTVFSRTTCAHTTFDLYKGMLAQTTDTLPTIVGHSQGTFTLSGSCPL